MHTTKQLLAAAVIAFTGSAAFAGVTVNTGDITSVNDSFVPMTSRADVKAGVLAARAAGVVRFVGEAGTASGMHDGASASPAFHSSLTREEVRSQTRAALRSTPSVQASLDNPAA